MWPYWMLFLIPAWMSLKKDFDVDKMGYMLVLMTLMIGFRYEVGGDWLNYLPQLDAIASESLSAIFLDAEPGYGLLNWFGGNVWGGIYFVNLSCALIFSIGLISFCRIQPRPWLALTVAVPYLIIVVAMGYTRQGAAIGLFMLGLVYLQENRIFNYVMVILLAASIHKTAVILLPLAVFFKSRRYWLSLALILMATFIFYNVLLKSSADKMIANYSEYSSSGAAIRIAMNAIPAAVLIRYRKKFIFSTKEQQVFWIWMSWMALGFVVWLNVLTASTAIDRLALYYIPLQLLVLSRVPDALGKLDSHHLGWIFLIIVYSAVVLFVWLNFSNYCSEWLPYKFYPLELLRS